MKTGWVVLGARRLGAVATRAALFLGLLCVSVLAAGCRSGEDIVPLDTGVPEETLEAFRCEPPVDSVVEAVIVAQRAIETTRLLPTEPPGVRVAEQVSFAEASETVGQEEAEAGMGFSDDKQVWLVILEGNWQIVPPGPATTPQPAESQCVFAIIDPEDCQAFQIGTMPCP